MPRVVITVELNDGVDVHDFADNYVSLIRATGDDTGEVRSVSYEALEPDQSTPSIPAAASPKEREAYRKAGELDTGEAGL